MRDAGETVAITRQDLLTYSGPSQLIASALMFRLFEQAFADLSPDGPPERRAIAMLVAFPGDGVLDGVEMVTRARTGGRLTIDTDAGPSDAPPSLVGRFYFEVAIGGRRRGYWPAEGYFTDQFRDQVARYQDGGGTAQEQAAYLAFKHQLVGRLLAAPPGTLFHARDLS
ncbi:hypothetical protein DEW08_27230 (plasmid) [Azospirillum thermophilum]|uniref:Uncharacterized protein n=1 Tax=Azospirillum thermophilum TaxID=2202148 RepID=A0A2S2CYX5_9PROT|nr:hypothetical protein DEW08_27230 [Azospirillum thermophilum]